MTGAVPARSPELAQFVQEWARAIDGTPHVPMTRAELHELLGGLVERLEAAVGAEPFDPMAGYWVATDLVAAGFDAPEALGRSLVVVDGRLRGDGGDGRVDELVQSFATGFARSLRDRTLDAQEEIRTAALSTRVRAEQALRHAALHDALTGLPNRARFLNRLRQLSTDSPGRLGVCHIGLDGLDQIKASLGPPVGDQLLQLAAARLRRFAGESGHLAARWADDQFVLLVEHTSCVDDVVKVADRVVARLSDPYQVGGLAVRVVVAGGIVERVAAGADPIELMRAADLGRHWAATDGKTWMVFDQARSARDLERYRLSAQLPGAIDSREFTLDYQALVDLRTGAVAGLEALARWQHPTLGVLSAERFIGLAEDTGMITRLGFHLLEQACYQASGWYELAERPPYVSVNLAVAQLRQPGLAGAVATILDRSGLPPSQLQLEITETMLIDPDHEPDRQIVEALRMLAGFGVRVVIDDFGTGYSNLAYLPALPLHGLKLARTFLNGPADDRFLATLVSLGHDLGLTITGEGVETAAQAERLAAAGCDLGQGWHLGRPMPADQATDRVLR